MVGSVTIISTYMYLGSLVLRTSGYRSSGSPWEKSGIGMEARPGRAQQKGMGMLSPAESVSPGTFVSNL